MWDEAFDDDPDAEGAQPTDVGVGPNPVGNGPPVGLSAEDHLALARAPRLPTADPVGELPVAADLVRFDQPGLRIVPLSEASSLADEPGRPTMGGHRLGDLSMIYETGVRPGREAVAAGKVSTGQRDPGGVSYGAYQLASSKRGGRQVQAFLRAEGAPKAPRFAGLDPGQTGGPFGGAWTAAAQQDPDFFNPQHTYIDRTHYQPVVRAVQKSTGLDINGRSDAVRDVVWSMAVQHGGAPKLVSNAVKAVAGRVPVSDSGFDRALINRLYDDRSAYVEHLKQPNLVPRYRRERRDALAMLPQ